MRGQAEHESCLHRLAGVVNGWVADGDVAEDLVVLAERHRLAPMLAWLLKEAGRPDNEALTRALMRSARRFTLHDIAQRDIQSLLAKAGIPAIWLKGAAIARSLYPDPTLRPMSDLDLLVPCDQCNAALDLLLASGYQLGALDSFDNRVRVNDPSTKTNHHYELVGGPSGGVAVEIHFRLLAQNDELLPMDRLSWFWRHTTEQAFDDGTAYTVLAPEANLLYLAAHAILQHGESEVLIHFLDMHLLITKENLDWKVVTDGAVELGWTGALERALRQTQDYFGTPIPDEVFKDLIRRRPAHEVDQTMGDGLRWERARGTMAGMTLAGKFRYLSGTIFPSEAYMRRRYDIRNERRLWRLYLNRWGYQARDVWAAVRKRVSGRESRAGSPCHNGEEKTAYYDLQNRNTARIVEQLLAERVPVNFCAGGQSMRPVICDGELVRVRPIAVGDIRAGAIVLYRRGDNLILHRMIRRSGGAYRTVADAAVRGIASVPAADILGVAEWVRRNVQEVRLDTGRGRLWGVCWYLLRPLRRAASVVVNHVRSSAID